MKYIISILFLVTSAHAANIKISELPLGNAATVLTNDAFPYVDTATATTKKLKISDIPNIPSFVATVAAALNRTTATIVASDTVPTLTKDYILNVDTSAGPITVTLPTGIASSGFCIDIKNIGSPVSLVTVVPFGIQLIDGMSSDTLTGQNDSKHYCAVSGNWFIY